jgi:hypothetical protein
MTSATATATVVRYRARPEKAEENAALVRAVYGALLRSRPAGLRYATFRLEGGDTFVHVAEDPGDLLGALPEFRTFLQGTTARFVAPAEVSPAHLVGTYPASGNGDAAAAVALAYLDAWCAGDFDRARGLLADDLAFVGPLSAASTAVELLALSEPLRPLLGGHRVVRHWSDGDDVCVVYDLLLAGDEVRVTEWITVRDGRVAADRVVFDTAAFSAAVPSSP